MLALLDLFPVVVFFAAYRFYDIYMATIALIVAMAAVIVVHWLVHGKVSKMLLVSGAFAAVLGGITLWQHDPVFLQWKPTIVYWIFAVVLLATDVITDKNVFQRTLGESVQAQRSSWRKLNAFWVVVFVLLGIANLYVASKFTESVWVTFKLYAAIGITVLIFAVTAFFLYRHMPEDQK
jgi:intracellular septation protein